MEPYLLLLVIENMLTTVLEQMVSPLFVVSMKGIEESLWKSASPKNVSLFILMCYLSGLR